LRCTVKIAGSPIIPQTFPEAKNLLLGSPTQRFKCRKLLHPAEIVWDDSFHLGLLEHDL
jgi:hypothetical protein